VFVDDVNNAGNEPAKIQAIQAMCARDMYDLALHFDTKISACDVLAPGCAMPLMLLRGDVSFFSGIYDCANYETTKKFDVNKYVRFQEAVRRVS
jgi:hypothetical protein